MRKLVPLLTGYINKNDTDMIELKQPKAIEPNKIYAYDDVDGVVYVLQHLRNIYGFKPILRGFAFSEYSSFHSREAIKNALDDHQKVLEFDSQADFFNHLRRCQAERPEVKE